jgi:hypothetical protein
MYHSHVDMLTRGSRRRSAPHVQVVISLFPAIFLFLPPVDHGIGLHGILMDTRPQISRYAAETQTPR